MKAVMAFLSLKEKTTKANKKSKQNKTKVIKVI